MCCLVARAWFLSVGFITAPNARWSEHVPLFGVMKQWLLESSPPQLSHGNIITHPLKRGKARDEGWMNERRRRVAVRCWTGKEGRCLSFVKGCLKCPILTLIFFSFHFVTQVNSPAEELRRHLKHLSWCSRCCLWNLNCIVSASASRPACVVLPPAGTRQSQILSRVRRAWGSCDRLIVWHPSYYTCLKNKGSRARPPRSYSS